MKIIPLTKITTTFISLVFILWISCFAGNIRSEPNLFPSDIQISSSTVTPAFPEYIEFHLNAKLISSGIYSKVALNFWPAGNTITKVRYQDLDRSTQDIDVTIRVDTQKDFLPPGIKINYYWSFYDSTGRSFDTGTREFLYEDERYPFKELQSGLIKVRWYEGSDKFGQALLDKAVAVSEKLSSLYKITGDRPITIHVYPDQGAFYGSLPPNTADYIGGQAFSELGAITLNIRPGDTREIGRSVSHEVSHVIIYQVSRNPYNHPPLWLDEGLAVSNQDQVEGFLLEAFQRGVDKHTLQTLRMLSGPFPTDPQLLYQSYGESYKIVQYLLERYGQEKIGQLLSTFKEGVSYDEALTRVLNLNTEELDRQWKLSIGYPLLPAISSTSTPFYEITPTVTLPGTSAATGQPGGITLTPVITEPTQASNPAGNSQNSGFSENMGLFFLEVFAGLAGVAILVGIGIVARRGKWKKGK